jgi:hypothetical protein
MRFEVERAFYKTTNLHLSNITQSNHHEFAMKVATLDGDKAAVASTDTLQSYR